MKIISLTGVTKSEEITVTKSIGSLIIATNVFVDLFEQEKISIVIERANGNNVILANKVLLKDFLLASSFGSEAIQHGAPDYNTSAICELANNGSIYLAENETIKINLDDLNTAKKYDLFGIEEPTSTNELYFFEQKSIAESQFNQKIDVEGFDLAIMKTDASVSDVSLHFANGKVIKYLPFELATMSQDIDPIQAISSEGYVMTSLPERVSLPLSAFNPGLSVVAIEVNKSQGAIINFLVRTLKNAL